MKVNPYNDIANAFDAIILNTQPALEKADQVSESKAENKYYSLYKKYKTKYLTLREKLSK